MIYWDRCTSEHMWGNWKIEKWVGSYKFRGRSVILWGKFSILCRLNSKFLGEIFIKALIVIFNSHETKPEFGRKNNQTSFWKYINCIINASHFWLKFFTNSSIMVKIVQPATVMVIFVFRVFYAKTKLWIFFSKTLHMIQTIYFILLKKVYLSCYLLNTRHL